MKSECRLSAEVYIGFGGNLGNPRETFERALKKISAFAEVRDISRLYRSKPYGFPDQPDFLNATVRLATELEPLALLRALRGVEAELGKVVARENGPRVIDLDLLLYGEEVCDSEELTLPHPRISERDFVLRPLHDLAPNLVHPVSRRTVSELLADLETEHVSGEPEVWQPSFPEEKETLK